MEVKQEGKVNLVALKNMFDMASKGDFNGIRTVLGKNGNLLNRGYPVNKNRTALHIAVTAGQSQVVTVLVDFYAADVNVKDEDGWTPLDEAVRTVNKKLADKLRSRGAEHGEGLDELKNKLIRLVAEGKNKHAKALVACGIDVNVSDYDGRTPLHLAVAARNAEMIQFLLDEGANGRAKDRFGSSPLDDVLKFRSRTNNDPIKELFLANYKVDEHEEHHEPVGWNWFIYLFAIAEIIMIVVFATQADYDFSAENVRINGGAIDPDFVYLSDVYGWFMDIHVMIFIGFGFLMTFLRKYNFSAVGLTFLIGAYCIQLHILVEYAAYPLLHPNAEAHGLHVSIVHLILGDFCAGAVLITYGVLLGKVNPTQLFTIATFEVVAFTVNELIGIQMGVTDVGGSMVVHMFGAFFGLSVSLTMQKNWIGSRYLDRNCSVYNSDTFAMIGTVFLWMFWPSFNVCLAADDESRHVGIINTVLALSGSCVVAFLASNHFRGERKFDMVDIQNATLAGGVAMGTSADLNVNPGLAVFIGGLGGLVSVLGYVYVQPSLEERVGLHDTCGVNNLHGMPSIVGATAGFLILFAQGTSETAEANFNFMVITLLVSMLSGIITGTLCDVMIEPMDEKHLFEDSPYWEVPGEEVPYYFDKRGEVERDFSELDNTHRVNNEIARMKARLDSCGEEMETCEQDLNRAANATQAGEDDVQSIENVLRGLLQHKKRN